MNCKQTHHLKVKHYNDYQGNMDGYGDISLHFTVSPTLVSAPRIVRALAILHPTGPPWGEGVVTITT